MKSQKPHHLARWEQGLIQCKVCLAYWYEYDAIKQARADERAKMQIQYREEIRTFKELCEKRLGRLLMDIVEHAQELVNRTFENKVELKEIK